MQEHKTSSELAFENASDRRWNEEQRFEILKSQFDCYSSNFNLADRGFEKICYELALCYDKGRGAKLNFDLAYMCYEAAANLISPHTESQYQVGLRLKDGKGVKKDEKLAMRWLRAAADNGHAVAAYEVGILAEKSGRDVVYSSDRAGNSRHFSDAVKYYHLAVQLGHPNAQTKLGALVKYLRDEAQKCIARGDSKAAKQYLEIIAEPKATVKDTQAQFLLASLYEKGFISDPDSKKMPKHIEYYQSLVRKEHAERKEQKEQKPWAKEYVEAIIKVGDYYEAIQKNGEASDHWYAELGQKPDYFYLLGVSQGSALAQNRMGGYREKEGSHQEAVLYYQKAANQNDKDAQYNLGRCYRDGIGAQKDLKKAKELFSKAAAQGHLQAKINLALFEKFVSGNVKKELSDLKAQADVEKVDAKDDKLDAIAKAQYQYAVHLEAYADILKEHDDNLAAENYYKEAKEYYEKAAAEYHQAAAFACARFKKIPPQSKKDYLASINPDYFPSGLEHNYYGYMYEFGRGEKDSIDDHISHLYRAVVHYKGLVDYYQSRIQSDKKLERPFKKALHQLVRASGELVDLYPRSSRSPKLAADACQYVADLPEAKSPEQAAIQYKLAEYYEKGQNVDRDLAKAIKYYRLAADNGYSGAARRLNSLVRYVVGGFGSDILKDAPRVQMIAYLQAAADPKQGNDGIAQYLLGQYYEKNKDSKKAIEYYELVAKCSNDKVEARIKIEALIKVANHYATDEKAKKTAFEFYQQANDLHVKENKKNHPIVSYHLGEMYEAGEVVTQDRKKAFDYYLSSADQGHADAQNKVGKCYENGTGVTENVQQAFKYYQKAVKGNNKEALQNLIRCYRYGIGVDQDLQAAVALLRSTSTKDQQAKIQAEITEIAQAQLIEAQEIEQSEDLEKAFQLFKLAAKNGNAEAQYRVGQYYHTDKRNLKEAAKYYQKAAEQGHAKAQYEYAMCLKEGKGVKKDEKQAFVYFLKAANRVHDAQYEVGICYRDGKGTPRDVKQAIQYLKAAKGYTPASQVLENLCTQVCENVQQKIKEKKLAQKDVDDLLVVADPEQGNDAIAQYLLGCLHENGYESIITKDEKEAKKQYQLAAEQLEKKVADESEGETKPELTAAEYYYLARLYEEGKGGVTQDLKLAFNYYGYSASATPGYVPAKNKMGEFYENDKGVKQDRDKAVQWYLEAANQGDTEGLYNVGRCYKDGIGIKQDFTQAKKYFSKAVAQGHKQAIAEIRLLEQDKDAYKKLRDEKRLQDPESQFQRARALELTRNKSNIEEALELYKAAAQNHQAADFAVGRINHSKTSGKTSVDTIEVSAQNYVKYLAQPEEKRTTVEQSHLAYAYEFGVGTKQDLKQAITHYEEVAKAYETEKSDAQYQTALSYKARAAVKLAAVFAKENLFMLAKEYYETVADNKNLNSPNPHKAEAAYQLGLFYEAGRETDTASIKKNETLAIEYFRKAKEQGHVKAKEKFEAMVKTNRTKAKELLSSPNITLEQEQKVRNYLHLVADSRHGNDAEAQFDYGQYWEKNKEDSNIAVIWYQLAAKQGHVEAQYRLAWCYELGIKDLTKAIEWYQKAANNGHSGAQNQLACHYQQGKGVAKNLKKAIEYYEKAAAQNDPIAQNELGKLYENGEGVDKDLKKAFEYYQKAAKHGIPDAYYNLGLCYRDGKGVKKDSTKARDNFNWAAERGHTEAKSEKSLYEKHGAHAYGQLRANAEQNNPEAWFKYAQALWAVGDTEKALEFYKKAQAQYHTGADFVLARIEYDKSSSNSSTEVLPETYAQLLYSSGEMSGKEHNHLGYASESGDGIGKYLVSAKRQYFLAVEAFSKDCKDRPEDTEAPRYLAEARRNLLRVNLALTTQYTKARELQGAAECYQYIADSKEATDSDRANAQYQLGVYYRDVDKDKDHGRKALNFFKQASENGHPKAQRAFESLVISYRKQGKEKIKKADEKIKAEGVQNLTWAAEQGDIEAQFYLAGCYEEGNGVEENSDEAMKWYNSVLTTTIKTNARKSDDYYTSAMKVANNYNVFDGKASDADKTKAFALYADVANATTNSEAQYKFARCYEEGVGTLQNLSMAIHWYKRAAENGNNEAYLKLGKFYDPSVSDEKERKANGWPKADLDEAERNYLVAANAQLPEAQYNLARCYEKDAKSSAFDIFYFYQAAAYGFDKEEKDSVKKKTGSVNKVKTGEAFYALGRCYLQGIGIDKNLKQAFQRFEYAVAKGNLNALFAKAECYKYGRGVQSDLNEAIKSYKIAAKKGHVESQAKLGLHYLKKEKATEDAVGNAVYYLTLAADEGNANAQNELGVVFLKGNKWVQKDVATAKKYLDLAARQQNPKALYNLGYFHEKGLGGTIDLNLAFQYYNASALAKPKLVLFDKAKSGYPDAYYKVGKCYETGQGVQKDEKQAFKSYLTAAKQKHPSAQNAVGRCYEQGIGVAANPRLAFEWYENAAKNGSIEAQNNLGRFYQHGIGVKQGAKEAEQRYLSAAQAGNIDAQFNLAEYYNAEGENQNIILAAQWYQNPANQGHVQAQLKIGRLCLKAGANDEAIHYLNLAARQTSKVKADVEVQVEAQMELGDYYKKQKPEKFIEYYELAAKNGNARAALELAKEYDKQAQAAEAKSDRAKAKENREKAEKYYLIANENPEAKNRLGEYYEEKLGAVGKQQAFKRYEEAAAQGNPKAQYNLARCYQDGTSDVKKDPKKALELFEKAYPHLKDDPEVNYYLGKCYQDNGLAIKAVIFYEQSANAKPKGNADAQFALAECYKNGAGVDQDFEQAVKYYQMAADNGHIKAQSMMGQLYLIGNDFVRKDGNLALHYLTLAVKDEKDGAAQNALGRYYQEFGKDEDKAFYYFELADKQNNPRAAYHLAMIYEERAKAAEIRRDTSGAKQNYIEAVKCCLKAADAGVPEAQNMAGNYYENGLSNVIVIDPEGAFKWYKKAADQGNTTALYNLGRCYQDSIGVTQNDKEALRAFQEVRAILDENAAESKKSKKDALKLKEEPDLNYRLAKCYQNRGQAGDAEEAVRLYDLAAKEGHIRAAVSLGRCYQDGLGVVQDSKRAFYYYNSANIVITQHKAEGKPVSDQENGEVWYHLGLCYERGIGCDKNEDKALGFYTLSAASENQNAQFRLGIFQETGQGGAVKSAEVKKNPKDTFKEYEIAAANGDKYADYRLGLCYQNGTGIKKNDKKAVEHYIKAANAGYADAQNALGVCYRDGKGVDKNALEAEKWFVEAAKQQNPEAEFNLGVLYQKGGKGLPKDLDKALRQYHFILSQPSHPKYAEAEKQLAECHKAIGYEKMAERYDQGDAFVPLDEKMALALCIKAGNSSKALCQQARYRKEGKAGLKVDLEASFELYLQAAKKGNAEAQYQVGMYYVKGEGVKQDFKEAAKWLDKAVRNDHPKAPHDLGKLYENGQGVKQNTAEAKRLYQLAAERDKALVQSYREQANNGIVEGIYNLGVCYEQGFGVVKNEKVAANLYQRAADRGHVLARYNLANLLFTGIGTEKNEKEAVRYYQLAADSRYVRAHYNLAYCLANGMGIEKNEEKAVHHYKISAEEGYVYAQYGLAICYELGQGVGINLKEAARFYRLAADQDHAEAQFNLGRCYEDGTGLGKDLSQAKHWYNLAANQGNKDAQDRLAALKAVEAVETPKEEIKASTPEAAAKAKELENAGTKVSQPPAQVGRWSRFFGGGNSHSVVASTVTNKKDSGKHPGESSDEAADVTDPKGKTPPTVNSGKP